jgi:hypothetical protein
MTWNGSRDHSHWREFAFMLNQVKSSIEPRLPLQSMLKNWSTISHGLAEPPRKRKSQGRQMESQAQTT